MAKEYAAFPMELAEMHAKGRTLVGYASAFDTDVMGPGEAVTRFAQGAWTKTLKEHADEVQVLFNHGMDPTLGLKPLGRPEVMKQDQRGLWTETPLDKTSWNDDIIESLKSGALRSMSVTFEPKEFSINDDRTVRTITQARLWEFGPVTFPANPGATAALHTLDVFGVSSDRAEAQDDGGRVTPPPTLERLTWQVYAESFENDVARVLLEQKARLDRIS
jgi:HK97 family phage prohead protease